MVEVLDMRRGDREVTELSRIVEIINSCDCCRLGLVDGDEAYIVPMNFGYDRMGEHIVLYFHCAGDGRRMSLLPQQSIVAFEMDTKHVLIEGELGCGFSCLYQSVMGTGTISVLHSKEEKVLGLQKIMEHYTDNAQWEFDEKLLNVTKVLKLSVEALSCKEH